ncbi:MAG: hypothetical protein H6993_09445 [Pseudomonadales bacterium]|nr:hypothetical protein [Pseudomonadales bacterium]MCP5184175.1 hypothetical protein [Pseudomonadales bacterium]
MKPWLAKARELERAGQLEAAEALIRDAVPDAHFALLVAELYLERFARLTAENDADGAAEANASAQRWAYFFAAQATSGGEGRAFEVERDDFLRRLRQ